MSVSSDARECVHCGLECVAGAWVAIAPTPRPDARAHLYPKLERFLFECDERVNRSERYDRHVLYTSNYSLLVANRGTNAGEFNILVYAEDKRELVFWY